MNAKVFEGTLISRIKVLGLESKLAEFLKEGKDWERKATTLQGVFVLKMPTYKGAPVRLAVELNPVDSEGRPSKKRGILLRSSEELAEYSKIIGDNRIANLLKNIDSVNPRPAKKEEKKPDVIEL
ncbi:hypothetical protein [[Eubacterium] cellulosolvens]